MSPDKACDRSKGRKAILWGAIVVPILCLSLVACSRSERNPKETPLVSKEPHSVCAKSALSEQTYGEAMAGLGQPPLNPEHTPLMKAAFEGDIQSTANELLSRRGSIDIQDKYGYTALIYAVLADRQDIFSLLVANGANIKLQTQFSDSAVTIAAIWGRTEMLSELIQQKKIDPNFKDEKEETLLHIAAAKCRTETARLLIEKGAHVNVKDHFGRTPLMDAVQEGALEVVEMLLEKKANPKAKTKDGNTALHLAMVDFGIWSKRLNSPGVRLNIVKRLIEYGAETSTKNKEGQRPVDLAELNLDAKAQAEVTSLLR